MQLSRAEQYAQSKGWDYHFSGDQIVVRVCPFNPAHSEDKFYMATAGNKDGCWDCKVCGDKSGNLTMLMEMLGDKVPGVEGTRDWAASKGERYVDKLPDIEACHQALLANADAMDYLISARGFPFELIERQKLGYRGNQWFKELHKEAPALVFPYLTKNGKCQFAKFRTLPPEEKAFASPSGWDAPLYNESVIQPGLPELIFTEGEPDTLAFMAQGIEYVVGVPGAGLKKAAWVEKLDEIGPKVYTCYDIDKVGQAGAAALAARIEMGSKIEVFNIVLPPFTYIDDDGNEVQGKDINEWFRHGEGTVEAFEALKARAKRFDVNGVKTFNDALDSFEAELEGKEFLKPKYSFPWPSVSHKVGMEDGDVVDILAPEKVGKMQSVDSLVKTPTGWKRMGDLHIGDALASIDGEPSYVTAIFPHGQREMFRVTFSDGRSTLAGAEHLWKVRCTNEWERDVERIYTTDAIRGEYCYPGSRRSSKLYIPLVSGNFGDTASLPIDPWLLGVLIGDGGLTSTSPRLTNIDADLLVRVHQELERMGLCLRLAGSDPKGIDYRISTQNAAGSKVSDSNSLTDALRKLGLAGCTSATKFIPDIYLNAGKEQRWELLRGLMDTDGTAGNKHGTASYTSVSEHLALNVRDLVRSLGGVSYVSLPQKKSFLYKGERRTGQPAYLVSVRMPNRENLFSLPRKQARIKPRKHQPRLTFKSIVPEGTAEALCIKVSHPSQLYITDDYIVTHNTTFGLNVIDSLVEQSNEDGLVICLEMTQERLVRKMVCYLTGTDDGPAKTDDEAREKLAAMKAAIPLARKIMAERKGQLYFAYPHYQSPDDIYDLIKRCVRKYGIKFVILDNIQLLCDTTLKDPSHRTIHLSKISKDLTALTKSLKIILLRILQPHRVRKGEICSSDNVDGSSQIAKDCDAMIVLHRNKIADIKPETFQQMGFIDLDGAYEPQLLVGVRLSRYSNGGVTTLKFDGATSRVTEWSPDDKPQSKVPIGNAVPVEKLGGMDALNAATAQRAAKASVRVAVDEVVV